MIEGVALWVPIISAVGSLGIGAFVGALANHLLHERTERGKNEKEKQALAILLRTEILGNDGSLQFLLAHPRNLVAEEYSPPLTLKTWEDARVRLAQLLPGKDLVVVMNYYNNLHELLDDLPAIRSSRKDLEMNPDEMYFMEQKLTERLIVVEDAAKKAERHLDMHIPKQFGFNRASTPLVASVSQDNRENQQNS
jgi:hypothetical protein